MSILKKLPFGWNKVEIYGNTRYQNFVYNYIQENIPTEDVVLPPHWSVQVSKNNKYYFYNSTNNYSTWHIPPPRQCNKINGLFWTGNSCFIDSTIVALFANPSPLSNQILFEPIKPLRGENRCGMTIELDIANRTEIQNALKEINNTITNQNNKIKYCTNLRKAIAKCPSEENFHLPTIGDSGEFLAFIFGLFNITGGMTQRITYGTNYLGQNIPHEQLVQSPDVIVDNQASCIIWAYPEKLLEKKVIKTKDLIYTSEDSGLLSSDNLYKMTDKDNMTIGEFQRRITYTKFIQGAAIIFNLGRIQLGIGFIDRLVFIDSHIKLESGQTFKLTGVVLYVPGHYKATILCGEDWYLYDDAIYSSLGMEKIGTGTFNEMILATDANTTATQLFYVPV